MKKLHCLLLLVCLSFVQMACAQQPPFWNDIEKFKLQDSVQHFPGQHPIVFTGSSSFTYWKTVNQDFPGYPIINRGFGGSTLTDVIRYVDDVVIKYTPKQVIIYCGENDFAGDTSLMPSQVAVRFTELFKIIRKKLPYAHISYVSMKPSPSRKNLLAKYEVANGMIKAFLEKKKRTDFIDVYHAMLNSDGTVMTDIFLKDNLHMNKKGYDIWQKIIGPYLK